MGAWEQGASSFTLMHARSRRQNQEAFAVPGRALAADKRNISVRSTRDARPGGIGSRRRGPAPIPLAPSAPVVGGDGRALWPTPAGPLQAQSLHI
jgi:hypothetical protein